MNLRGHIGARRVALDIAIAGQAGAAVAANTQTHRRAAPAARACYLDTSSQLVANRSAVM